MAVNEQKPMFEFNELRMYFGDDYKINDYITVHQPTIQEIVDYGDNEYYSMINTLCSIPSDLKSLLFDNGIDWEEMKDFELFISLSRSFDQAKTSIILGDLDLSNMIPFYDNEINNVVLIDQNNVNIRIDMYIYQHMIDYLRTMHGIVPQVEKSLNKRSKIALIEYDRQQKKEQSEEKPKSILKPLISSMVNSAGFKYKKDELREIKIVEFMDSVQRIQLIMSTDSLLKGVYSGMVDVKKIDKKEFNWMRELVPQVQKGEDLLVPNQNKKA